MRGSDKTIEAYLRGIADALLLLRRESGMTMSEAASRTGLGVSEVEAFELGTFEPRITTLLKFCAAFGVTLSEFCDKVDEVGR